MHASNVPWCGSNVHMHDSWQSSANPPSSQQLSRPWPPALPRGTPRPQLWRAASPCAARCAWPPGPARSRVMPMHGWVCWERGSRHQTPRAGECRHWYAEHLIPAVLRGSASTREVHYRNTQGDCEYPTSHVTVGIYRTASTHLQLGPSLQRLLQLVAVHAQVSRLRLELRTAV